MPDQAQSVSVMAEPSLQKHLEENWIDFLAREIMDIPSQAKVLVAVQVHAGDALDLVVFGPK